VRGGEGVEGVERQPAARIEERHCQPGERENVCECVCACVERERDSPTERMERDERGEHC